MKLVIAWFTEGSVDTSKTERRDVSWGLLGIFGKNMANCLYSNTFSKDLSISAGERELRRNQMRHNKFRTLCNSWVGGRRHDTEVRMLCQTATLRKL